VENPRVLCGITKGVAQRPRRDQHGIYAFSSLSSALQRDSWTLASIGTPQMSPSADGFNNRVRVIDFDVAAPVSPLGLWLAKCKITINVLINSIIHVHTDTRAGPLPVQTSVPFYQRRSTRAWPCSSCQIRFEPVWPYSIRSLRQPLSSSRSITYQKRALRSCSDRPSRQSSTRAGFAASESGVVNSSRGSSGG
jgi:hypothetical protein